MNIYSLLLKSQSFLNDRTDPRVSNWLFVSSPFPTLGILSVYLFIVCFIGPRYMKKRDAFDLRKFLPFYNFALVMLNFYIAKLAFVGSYNAGYSYVCTPLRRNSLDENELKVTMSIWWFYFSKHIELVDTIVFVLRKQYRQVSFLHVYHHTTMPFLWWLGVKLVPGGQSFFIVLLNSSIHVVMYTYYCLAALGPKMKKYLWWKRYLTILQLTQFCSVLVHTATSLYVECPQYPIWMHWLVLAHCTSILLLFANFYYHSYLSKNMSKACVKKTN